VTWLSSLFPGIRTDNQRVKDDTPAKGEPDRLGAPAGDDFTNALSALPVGLPIIRGRDCPGLLCPFSRYYGRQERTVHNSAR
jgi:hypothetical protein